MSGWIKYEKDLETDPRFLRMLRTLRHADVTLPSHTDVTAALERAQLMSLTCGALVRFWAYADTHLRSDDRLDLGPSDIDALVGVPGFCVAMPEDWLVIIDDVTVELPNYQGHNGVAARKRDLAQKRQETKRRKDGNTGSHAAVTRQRDNGVTGALPDQTRPDQTKTKSLRSSSSESLPKSSSGRLSGGKTVYTKREAKKQAVEALVKSVADQKRLE